MESIRKTPTYTMKAIKKYQEKKKEDPEYVEKLREYRRIYMKRYRKLQKDKKNVV
jgi:hypothetical protein